ncbi:MAG TPA: isoleucine--tRNA ligase [Acidimicrobiales bacterium]|nr:isoleucine--tRNA ligase [Acidimicrobiales bacterium]
MGAEPLAPPYPKVDGKPNFPAIERRILEEWKANRTFEQSVESRAGGSNEYLFFDGPPFANGLPHYGHLLTGYVKDVVPRYQTMRGHRVERRFGWDCHGLPAEMEAEKELKVAGRRAITEYGIAAFNEYCRTSVLRYTKEWEEYVTRQARWVDFENDYKTMDLPYMESVMWAFKQLWDKGLVYEAYRVMPYSWGAETPLSNFEIRLDDATRPRQDPAITVTFSLVPDAPDEPETRILAWTTTPWTLPSNLALAVGPTVEYAIVTLPDDPVRYIIGDATRDRYAAQLAGATVVATVTGDALVGRKYEPLFPYFAEQPRAFRVLAGDFVDTSEGTGVVHLAPGFGEDDQTLCVANGIALVVPVDDEGRFTDDVVEWAGENVFDANPRIIRHLKDAGRIVRHDTYEHNYPHCWRTDTPIIYRALSSWYVEVTAFRDRLVELNQQINWIPEHVRDGAFGKWIENARDWSISRNRFWGAPIPVWRSDDPDYPRTDVYGSIAELERDFGVTVTDLHRPFIDTLVRPNPDDPTGRSMMRRVPEVLDCWFESGSMPFAQAHYPFENKDWVDQHTADFIVEYIPQTRGWFYTMHVLSVALFDRPAFKNCICHGIILDEDGRKLSKRLRNYPDPVDVFETIGSDALRWFLMASPILRGGDVRIDRDGSGISDAVRLVVNPIWNAYSFFTLYANVDGYRARYRADSTQLLDRYVLAKTRQLVESVTARMDTYDLAGACADITAFLDALNNWYVRRSRDRFWAPGAEPEASADKHDAYDTLYTVLHTLIRVAAPLLPFVAEEVYRGLTGEQSVHLADWPDAAALPADPALVAAMDRVRDVCSTALRLREETGLRVRLPLASLVVAGRDSATLEPLAHLIADEVNVKRVLLSDDLAAHATFVLRPNGKVLGPRLGKDMQAVFAAARSGQWIRNDDGTVTVAGQTLEPAEYDLALESPEGVTAAALRSNDTVITLDTTVTAELQQEGLARDVIRVVQQARKDADLVVTDRIVVHLDAPARVADAVGAHERMVKTAVLAEALHFGPVPAAVRADEAKIDGQAVHLGVAVVPR